MKTFKIQYQNIIIMQEKKMVSTAIKYIEMRNVSRALISLQHLQQTVCLVDYLQDSFI